MAKRPITIDPEAPLATAIAVMREKEIRHLPVVDDVGRLVGIITERDLRSAALAPALAEFLASDLRRAIEGAARMLEELRVKDAMTWRRPSSSSAESEACRSAKTESWSASSPNATSSRRS